MYNFLQRYSEDLCIQSTFDAIQSIFHSFSGTCLLSDTIFECFKTEMIEIYKCECDFETVVANNDNFPYFPVYIQSLNDLNENNFCSIFKKNAETRKYKFCNRENCQLKLSTKKFTIFEFSDYIVFKIIWKINDLITNKNFLSVSFLTSDCFSSGKIQIFNLFLIVVSLENKPILFYENSLIWYNSENSEIFQFNELVKVINQRKYQIELIFYRKKEESEKKVIKQEEKIVIPQIDSKIRTSKSPNAKIDWICLNCNSRNEYLSKFCLKCKTTKPGENGWLCLRCENFIEGNRDVCWHCDLFLKSSNDFTNKKCKTCNQIVKNGKNCINCTQKTENLRKTTQVFSEKIQRPNSRGTICNICSKSLGVPYFCFKCNSRINSGPCETCKKGEPKFICKACFEIVKKSREEIKKDSNGTTKKKARICSACRSILLDSEMRNCIICRKKRSSMNCTICHSNLENLNHVCDKCLTKYS